MEIIDEQQEQNIDDSIDEYNNLYFIKDNKLIAKGKDIILYGKVDLENPNDLFYINKFNLINEEHSWLYSDLDFETGDVISKNGIFKQYPTLNAIKWFKYCHLLLGKPERIIIYKVKVKNKYARYSKFEDWDI